MWIEPTRELTRSLYAGWSRRRFSGNIRLRLPKSLHRDLAELAKREGISLNEMMLTLLQAQAERPRR